MSLKESLTPKNTEEIKPNLFIQKKGDSYRQVKPIVWKGEWRLKEQFSWKNLFWIAIVIFIAWGYLNDTGEFRDFYVEVKGNPVAYCEQFLNRNPDGGLNFDLSSINFTKENGEITNSLSDNVE